MARLFHFFICFLLFLPNLTFAKDKIRFGITSYYPPYSFSAQSGYIDGVDVQIVLAICARLNADCTFTPMPTNKLSISLNANQIDAAIGAINITPDKKLLFTFTKPYLKTALTLIAINNSDIPFPQGITNRRIGVIKDSANFTFAYRHFPNAQIVTFDTIEQLMSAVTNRKVDLALIDVPAADYWLTYNRGQFKKVGPPLDDPADQGFGIIVKKGNTQLAQQLNRGIVEANQEKRFGNIFDTFITRKK